MSQTIHIGADHRGFALKEQLKAWLMAEGHEVVDHGNTVLDPEDDFPPYAFKLAEAVAEDEANNRGILVCGSGVGVTIAANKVPGARASLGLSSEMVKKGREDDDMNILVLAADFQDQALSQALVTSFLNTPVDTAERRQRRLQQIKNYEQRT